MVGTQFHSKVKVFRTDNWIEFNMRDFFASKGTLHQLSYVETPQQKGVMERKPQYKVDISRALKFQPNLPLSFWADCVLAFVYVINLLPVPIFNNKIPDEL